MGHLPGPPGALTPDPQNPASAWAPGCGLFRGSCGRGEGWAPPMRCPLSGQAPTWGPGKGVEVSWGWAGSGWQQGPHARGRACSLWEHVGGRTDGHPIAGTLQRFPVFPLCGWKMVGLLGLRSPESSGCGHVTRSHQWDGQEGRLCHFWAGAARAGPGGGLAPNGSDPHLGPERPEEEEARTNDQDPDGGGE